MLRRTGKRKLLDTDNEYSSDLAMQLPITETVSVKRQCEGEIGHQMPAEHDEEESSRTTTAALRKITVKFSPCCEEKTCFFEINAAGVRGSLF